MLTMEFDYEKLAEALRPVLREEVQSFMSESLQKRDLPPLLTRKEMMALLRISHDKAAELTARPDFPVVRATGRLIFPTDKLFEWIDRHTQWVENNTKYFKVG